MKKLSILTVSFLFALMFTACGEKVSNNLGGATRGNNAYDYNYSGTGNNGNNSLGFDANTSTNGNNGNNMNGAGYWDYYGITNGGINDTIRNGFVNNFDSTTPYSPSTAYNTATNGTGTTSTVLDSATIAD